MPFRILVVCTGNICRSAAAEQLIGEALAAAPVDVTSAGTQAVVGSDLHPLTRDALAATGFEPVPHVARQLTPDLVRDAGLLLTATRAHRTAAVQIFPAAVSRTFTLREFARIVETLTNDVAVAPGVPPVPVSWADPETLVAEARAVRGLVRAEDPSDDDIADPMGESPEVHQRVVKQLREAAEAIARAV
ncbi:MAG: hypothetical protein ACTHK1_10725 [Actinomycetales bacterium]